MFTLVWKVIYLTEIKFFYQNVQSDVILPDEFYVIKEIVHGYLLFGGCDIWFTSMPCLLFQ